MLAKSEKFGTELTVGPRLKRFIEAGYGEQLLWSERYPSQEESTPDGRGEFQRVREWIETASLEGVFDLWCRGQNLVRYAGTLLRAAETFRRIMKGKPRRAKAKLTETADEERAKP